CTSARPILAWHWPLATSMTCLTGSRTPQATPKTRSKGGQTHAYCYAGAHCLACATAALWALGACGVVADGRPGSAWGRGHAVCHSGFADARAARWRLSTAVLRRPRSRSEGLGMSAYCDSLRAG